MSECIVTLVSASLTPDLAFLYRQLSSMGDKPDDTGVFGMLAAMRVPLDELSALELSALLVVGGEDELCPPAAMADTAGRIRGATLGQTPGVRLDHVIFGVADLDVAMRRFADDFRLDVQVGGEHPQLGTRNGLVPVGDGQYIELMAVADLDIARPLPRFLTTCTATGDRPVALCLAPNDLDAVAARLSLDVVPGERHTPAREVVRWRMAGLEAALGPERLPLFIDWMGGGPGLDASLNSACGGIAWVEVGGVPRRFCQWVGEDAELPVRHTGGEPGPIAVGIRQGDDVITVR